ncbi:MAG TPA: hypothetical protein VK752_26520 [Bryobacteraceae bacterium]|jgi:hypothetical protein|nr:hypothetical protein [Bryobacteraceae bacterium]
MPAQPAPSGRMPSSVQIAIVLLLVTCAISLFSTATVYFTHRVAAMPMYLTRSLGLNLLMILFIAGLWQRQGWARIVILLYIAWTIGTMALSMTRVRSDAVLWAFAVPVAILLVRLCAGFLLFRPQSNTWFRT